MNIRSILLIVLLIGAGVLNAQERFRVLAVRGQVSAGNGAVKVGARLGLKDKLTLGKDGYVSLGHTNGRTLEVRKAGSYKVSDLDKDATKKGASASSKFASYVASELTEVKEPDAFRDVHRGRMRTTGAVERANGDEVSVVDTVAQAVGGLGEAQHLAMVAYGSISKGRSLLAIMPRHTRLLGDSIGFQWHPSPKATGYRLIVVDRGGTNVFDRTVSDTVVIAPASIIPEGQLCFWHVEAQGTDLRSDEYGLFRLNGDERRSTEQLIREVRSDVDDDAGAIGLLVLAAAYEDQGLVADAYEAYRKAVVLAPDVQNYKRMYAEFLRRQGLDLDAYAVYNK